MEVRSERRTLRPMDRPQRDNNTEISVSSLLRGLEGNDPTAHDAIWNRYFADLVALARKRLRSKGAQRRVRDEEDVVVSVFDSLFARAGKGEFPHMADEIDLWKLLITLTERKALNTIRHERAHKRGGGRVRGDSVFHGAGDSETAGLAEAAIAPSNAEADALIASVRESLEGIDAELAEIGALRLSGYTVKEIAQRSKSSVATIERRLNLLRRCLAERIVPP